MPAARSSLAGEVRLLAQRSAQAAREIKTLITGSIDKAEAGARIVEGAGDAMRQMVANAGRIDTLLSEVSAASAGQSDRVARTGRSIRELDATTQQNAALVEQTAAAASNLKDQAVQLRNEVARFKLPS
jgi:methyl-accepting chemotaxis protein